MGNCRRSCHRSEDSEWTTATARVTTQRNGRPVSPPVAMMRSRARQLDHGRAAAPRRRRQRREDADHRLRQPGRRRRVLGDSGRGPGPGAVAHTPGGDSLAREHGHLCGRNLAEWHASYSPGNQIFVVLINFFLFLRDNRRVWLHLSDISRTSSGPFFREQRGRPNARNGENGNSPENCGVGPGLHMQNSKQPR